MKLEKKICRCCGGANFKRCKYRIVNDFFGYYAIHINPTITVRGKFLKSIFGKKITNFLNKFLNFLFKSLFKIKNEIAYGACLDCNFISVWPEFSDDQLIDYYTCYLTSEYKLKRSQIDKGYPIIANNHGSLDELSIRRQQNEDFIAPYLKEYKVIKNVKSLKMLDYGGGSGLVAPSFDFLNVDLLDVGDKSIKQLKKQIVASSTEKIPKQLKSYDFIQLLHVIEHVGHPLNVVRNSLQYLKKDGLIFIEVPWEMTNFDQLTVTSSITCDEHINKFCNLSLLQMMKFLKLKILFCEGAYIKLLHSDAPIKVVRCLAKNC